MVKFCRVQLSYSPLNGAKKRVGKHSADGNTWNIGYRTWRIFFRADEAAVQ
jgi:hypothetical protein